MDMGRIVGLDYFTDSLVIIQKWGLSYTVNQGRTLSHFGYSFRSLIYH